MKKHQKSVKKQDDGTIHLNERLSADVLNKLKATSKELKEAEMKKIEEAKQLERQKRLEKEKNKSFADLLEESNLDWKKYK